VLFYFDFLGLIALFSGIYSLILKKPIKKPGKA